MGGSRAAGSSPALGASGFPTIRVAHDGPPLSFSFANGSKADVLLQNYEPPNARRELQLEAGARHERTLEAVACTPSFGAGVTAMPGLPPIPTPRVPPMPSVECSG
jgi:hypothetical protein